MMENDNKRQEIIQVFLHDIEEFCDGCQVNVSGTDPDGSTWSLEAGVGNVHARIWVTQHWLSTMAEDGGGSVLEIKMTDDEGDDEEDE